MATLICIWDAPGSKLATWPTATFALYTDTHCVTALHSYTTLYSAIHYTAIQLYSAIHSTTSTTPLCRSPRAARRCRPRVQRARRGGCAPNAVCACGARVCPPIQSATALGRSGARHISRVHKSEESRRRLMYGGDENSDIREHVRSASSMAGTFVRGSM